MTLWIWPLVVLAVVSVVALLVSRELRESTRGDVERRFVCPVGRHEVTATFVSDFFDPHRFQGVRRCSTFGPEVAPRCDLACLAISKDELAAQHERLQPRILAGAV